jgi:DNA primase
MDQLDEIRSKIDLVDFISEYVPLKKTGRNFKALCPFHTEKTPSFIVSPERQIWKCFGCGLGGDAFRFLMEIDNLEFGEALRELAKRTGVKLRQYRPSPEEKRKELFYEINHLSAEFYHYLLLKHPVGKSARDYILGRGITKESLELFRLGFAPDLWEGLEKYLVGKKGYRLEDLEEAGLIIRGQRSGYYDRFRGRLMFPLRDHRGNVCGFAGRVLAADVKEARLPSPAAQAAGGQAKYINSPETPVYHKSDLLYGLFEAKEAIKKADEAILVEGELDMISSFQTGVKNVVAIKGSALTSVQTQIISRFTKNLTLALDKDIAGDLASRRGIEIADAAGMSIKVVEITGGKDPDEVAQKNPELWKKLIKKAVPVYDYFLDSAASRFGTETIEAKRKIGEELAPILAKISNEIVQSHYIGKLAQKLGVSEEAVSNEVTKAAGKETPVAVTASLGAVIEALTRQEILEEYLLALCFQSDRWQWLKKRAVKSCVKTPRFIKILETLAEYFKKYKTKDSQRLAKMLPAELIETFNRFYLLDLGGTISDEEKLSQEFGKNLSRLRELILRQDLEALAEEIRKLEAQKPASTESQKKLDGLNQQFRDLSAQLVSVKKEAGQT